MTEQITTRQMLELAAKAAGNTIIRFNLRGCDLSTGSNWNPAHMTADSAGLAIRLKMTVSVGDASVRAEREVDGVLYEHTAMLEDHGGCPGSAYRYAILSVSARIGAQMP